MFRLELRGKCLFRSMTLEIKMGRETRLAACQVIDGPRAPLFGEIRLGGLLSPGVEGQGPYEQNEEVSYDGKTTCGGLLNIVVGCLGRVWLRILNSGGRTKRHFVNICGDDDVLSF